MKRRAQLWRFCDEHGRPLTAQVPATSLHRLLAGLDPVKHDLTLREQDGFRMQVEASQHPGDFVMHRLRIADLPNQYSARRVRPLPKSVRGLAEGTNLRLIERNLAVFITNGFSPRPPRFADFLRKRVGWPDVYLRPVPRANVGAILANLRRVSSIDVSIAADEARRLDLTGFFEGEDDPLYPVQAAVRAGQGGVIGVHWGVGRGHPDQAPFRRLLDRVLHMNGEGFSRIAARVYIEGTDEPVPIDFLNDRIVTQIEIDQQSRSRTLTAESAAVALGEARRHFIEGEGILDFIDPVTGPAMRTPSSLAAQPEEDDE